MIQGMIQGMMHIKFHIINKNFHSQNQDHLIVHFTRNGRVNKTNFYHMQVLLQFPKGNDFKTELRRANSCIRSLRASDGQNGPNFFGTLVKCGNNELSRFTIQFFWNYYERNNYAYSSIYTTQYDK